MSLLILLLILILIGRVVIGAPPSWVAQHRPPGNSSLPAETHAEAFAARYNGDIERGIGNLKAQLPVHLVVPSAWHLPTVEPTLRGLGVQQNAELRPALDQQSACHRFYSSPSRRFGKRERANAFESIRSDLNAKLKQMENPNRRDFHAAWRKATEHWLVCQNLISVSSNKTSVTPFSGENGLTN